MLDLFKNKKKVYLDHSAATPLLKDLQSNNSVYYNNNYYNIESLYHNPSSIYDRGVLVNNIIRDCKIKVSKILNCRNSEIFWSASGTESINIAIRGFIYNKYFNNIKNNLQPIKVNVITTNIEHSAVLETLFDLQSCQMINLYILNVEKDGVLSPNVLKTKIQELIDKKTNPDLVSIMYVNNEIGTIQNIKEYGRIIEEYNRNIYKNTFDNSSSSDINNHKIVFHIDACQAANYLDLDIRKLKVDMMSLNSSKIYAGKGCGLLYKNKNIKISPIITGGGQEDGLRSGTENINSIINFTIALLKLNQITERQKESQRLRQIQKNIILKLRDEIKEIKFWPHLDSKVSTDDYLDKKVSNNINISLEGMDSDQMVLRLNREGFEVSHKSACNAMNTDGSYVLQAIGASERESRQNIRITMGRETTIRDMDKFVKVLKKIYYKYREL